MTLDCIGTSFVIAYLASLLAGLVCGCGTAVALRFWPELSPLPAIHSGIWAFLLNLLVIVLLQTGATRHLPSIKSNG